VFNRFLASGLIATLVLAGLQTWRLDRERLAHERTKVEHATALQQATAQVIAETQRMQDAKDQAIAEAQQIAKRNAAAAAAAGRERDRLRNELRASRAALANSTQASVVNYADALSTVFEQCVREYLDMATKADGHALDAQRLYNGWQGIANKLSP
jgi:hypothetical protein